MLFFVDGNRAGTASNKPHEVRGCTYTGVGPSALRRRGRRRGQRHQECARRTALTTIREGWTVHAERSDSYRICLRTSGSRSQREPRRGGLIASIAASATRGGAANPLSDFHVERCGARGSSSLCRCSGTSITWKGVDVRQRARGSSFAFGPGDYAQRARKLSGEHWGDAGPPAKFGYHALATQNSSREFSHG